MPDSLSKYGYGVLMEQKRCPKCGEEKPLTREFWITEKKCKDLLVKSKCRMCWNARARELDRVSGRHRKKNSIFRATIAGRAYHRERERARRLRPEAIEVIKRRYDNHVKTISTTYIKGMLHKKGIASEDITTDMIECNRQMVIMTRLIRRLYESRSPEAPGN